MKSINKILKIIIIIVTTLAGSSEIKAQCNATVTAPITKKNISSSKNFELLAQNLRKVLVADFVLIFEYDSLMP